MRSGLPSRITEIEGIRGILSVIVVLGHMHFAPLFLYWFWGCMEVFFCISGFVITRILLENLGRPGFLRNYFIRRILRIWPMYYVAMIFAYLVHYVTAGSTNPLYGVPSEWHPQWFEVLMPLLYLQNVELYFGLERFKHLFIFDHSWSVAAEEQFYLLWPFVIALVTWKASAPTRLFTMAAGIGLAVILRTKYLGMDFTHYWLLGTRFDGFVLGAALAYLESAAFKGQKLALRVSSAFRWLWILPLLTLTPYLSKGPGGLPWGLPGFLGKTVFDPFFDFALLGFCLVGYCVFHGASNSGSSRVVRVLNLRPLQHLGTISYSTYLLHVPVVFALTPYLMAAYELPSIFSVIIGFGLSIGLAHFSYKFVEATAMRLKKHFAYAAEKDESSRSAVSSTSPATPYEPPAAVQTKVIARCMAGASVG